MITKMIVMTVLRIIMSLKSLVSLTGAWLLLSLVMTPLVNELFRQCPELYCGKWEKSGKNTTGASD